MKALKQWAFALTIDGIYAALFYLWQFKGIAGAGSVLLTFLWLIVPLGLLAAFFLDEVPVEKLRRPKSLVVFTWVTSLALFGALAWSGHEVLAALQLFVSICCYAARSAAIGKAEKTADETLPHNLLIISGGAGSGKTTALEIISDLNTNDGKRVLNINHRCTDASLRTILRDEKPDAAILDECSPERDLRALAEEFPNVRFFAVQ